MLTGFCAAGFWFCWFIIFWTVSCCYCCWAQLYCWTGLILVHTFLACVLLSGFVAAPFFWVVSSMGCYRVWPRIAAAVVVWVCCFSAVAWLLLQVMPWYLSCCVLLVDAGAGLCLFCCSGLLCLAGSLLILLLVSASAATGRATAGCSCASSLGLGSVSSSCRWAWVVPSLLLLLATHGCCCRRVWLQLCLVQTPLGF